MNPDLRRAILYALERLLVRGAHYRFLLVVATIGLVSVCGGLLLLLDTGSSEAFGEATWWAFLRLTDPGYLGDDEGLWRRVVSTMLTVLGYVIFLGAMVAILTQWLNDTLGRLEQGRTPIRQSGHVVILGWTNRTRSICRDLASAEGRLSRWLKLRGIRRLKVAILANKIGPERDVELRNALGKRYRRQQFVLRSGSYLRAMHLRRVDVEHAATIVLPGIEATSQDALLHDAMVIKTLRGISAGRSEQETLPPCVCEIFDPRKVSVARLAYRGPLQVLASDVIIGRLLADNLGQPGASDVLDELLTHGVGGTLYIRTWHADATTVAVIRARTPRAIFVGVVSNGRFNVSPGPEHRVDVDDALVFVARDYEDTDADADAVVPPAEPQVGALALPTLHSPKSGGRVLILGWSRRIPDLLAQLDGAGPARWSVDVLSAIELERRERDLEDHGIALVNTELRQLRGDLTVPGTLAAVEPGQYDHVFLVASDWPATGEASDARSVSTYVALEALLADVKQPPTVLVELADEGNHPLFQGSRTQVLVSPRILSSLLALVVLRPQLELVFSEIFGEGATQLRFAGAGAGAVASFGPLASQLRAQGSIAIGVRRGALGAEIILAPRPDLSIDFGSGDVLIVLEPGDAMPRV